MKYYDDTKLLYLETDASGVGLGAALLQLHDNTTCQKDMVPDSVILHPIAFASKSLTGAEWRYSNIEREALGILHGLEKFTIIALAERYSSSLTTNCWYQCLKKMLPHCHIVYSASCLKFINTGSRLHINLGLRFLLQIGYLGTIMSKARTNPSRIWTSG